MRAFKQQANQTSCHFDEAEIQIMYSLVSQLIELIVDASTLPGGPGTRLEDLTQQINEQPQDYLDWLENDLGQANFNPIMRQDPAIARLFPCAYKNDASADYDYRRFTQQDLINDKLCCAQRVLKALDEIEDDGCCIVKKDDCDAWLKTLTSLRLTLASRLGIKTLEDSETLGQLSERDPDSYAYSIYEWLGYVQESMLTSIE